MQEILIKKLLNLVVNHFFHTVLYMHFANSAQPNICTTKNFHMLLYWQNI